jgi:hypothetical protein
VDAVLLAADDADLELEDHVRLGALGEQFLGDLEVLVQNDRGAVPHVGLEERRLAARDPLLRDLDERPDEAVELVLGAVVGVQGDVDVVVLRDLVGEQRKRHRTGHHVLHRGAGQVLRPTGRHLHDAVAAGVGEALDGRVQGLRRGDVDGGVGKAACPRPVEHVDVDLGGGDRHLGTP